MKGFVYGILLGLIVLSGPIIVAVLSGSSVANDPVLYKKEFAKLGIYSNFEQGFPDAAAENLTAYFKSSPKPILNLSQMTAGELSHLKDVRKLLSVWSLIAYSLIFIDLLLLFVIAFSIKQPYSLMRMAGKALVFCGLLCLAAVFLISFSFLFFSSSFAAFHSVFFPQGNWEFPETSTLIRLFPEQFFFDMGLKIVFRAFLISTLLLLLGFVLRRGLKEHPWASEMQAVRGVR